MLVFDLLCFDHVNPMLCVASTDTHELSRSVFCQKTMQIHRFVVVVHLCACVSVGENCALP